MQRILIVDDDTNINNLLREALSKARLTVESALQPEHTPRKRKSIRKAVRLT